MHGLNTNYGHQAIFSSFVGCIEERSIWGVLQHGWNAYDGFSPSDEFSRLRPLLVWSEAAKDRVQTSRLKHKFIVTGAPFAYLLSSNQLLQPKSGNSIIAFPHHTAETEGISNKHEEYASQLRENEGRSVRVCLYWLDYQDQSVVETYRSYGHEVVTVGATRTNRFYIPLFLKLLDGCGKVVSNIVSTATIYSASLGIETVIYGPNMGLSSEAQVEYSDTHKLIEHSSYPFVVPKDFAACELGWDNLCSPRELERRLGWTGHKRFLGPILNVPLSWRRQVLDYV